MNSPGTPVLAAPQGRHGSALDCLMKNWISTIRGNNKEFTVSVNGPWHGDINAWINITNLKKPVVIRFMLSDPPTNIITGTLNSLQRLYESLKQNNNGRDFLFLLVRKVAPLPDGCMTLKLKRELSQNLQDLLGLTDDSSLYEIPHRVTSPMNSEEQRIQETRFRAFAAHFRILTVKNDVVDLANAIQRVNLNVETHNA